MSDQLAAAFIQAPFTPRPIYYAPPATTVTDTHQAILTRWNAGAGLILYHGHSSVRQWAAERLFHRDDVAALRNARQLPVVLQMTCFTGLFHEPGGTTLDETLLRAAEGGAVAVWGPTGLGVATGHQQLAQGFLASAFQRHEGTIGAGTLSGKLKLVASGSSALDLVDTFTLLGDPATNLNLTLVPWPTRDICRSSSVSQAGGRAANNVSPSTTEWRLFRRWKGRIQNVGTKRRKTSGRH